MSASSIMDHLGGEGFLVSLGARDFVIDETSLSFTLIHDKPSGVRSVSITIDANGEFLVTCYLPSRQFGDEQGHAWSRPPASTARKNYCEPPRLTFFYQLALPTSHLQRCSGYHAHPGVRVNLRFQCGHPCTTLDNMRRDFGVLIGTQWSFGCRTNPPDPTNKIAQAVALRGSTF